MINNKILLVEDEESLAKGLEFNLKEEGYFVVWVADGKKALEEFANQKFDIIILDIMLPYYDGFEVAKKVREEKPTTPILMLTARSGIKDKVKGLELGADDYITKPFQLEELLARVKSTLKRKKSYQTIQDEQDIYRFGNNLINFNNFTAKAGDKEIRLTKKEAALLQYLIGKKGSAVSREELLNNIWNIDQEVETRTVDIFIARLRKYFEKDTKNPRFFKSVRGVGYMFTDDKE
ncbi:MAG TPA: response regulator transcription factor [bacterium]|nr:response regulator transcription factor [bacterium]